MMAVSPVMFAQNEGADRDRSKEGKSFNAGQPNPYQGVQGGGVGGSSSAFEAWQERQNAEQQRKMEANQREMNVWMQVGNQVQANLQKNLQDRLDREQAEADADSRRRQRESDEIDAWLAARQPTVQNQNYNATTYQPARVYQQPATSTYRDNRDQRSQVDRESQMAYDRANLPADLNERLATLDILAARDPVRYGSLKKEAEEQQARQPARPLFAEPLSSFAPADTSISPQLDAFVKADMDRQHQHFDDVARQQDLQRASQTGAASTQSGVDLGDVRKTVLGAGDAWYNRNDPEKFAGGLEKAGDASRNIRYQVLGNLAGKNKADTLGFAPVMNSWMEYNETVTDEAGSKGWNLDVKKVNGVGAKVKKAWSQFLDDTFNPVSKLDDK